MFTMEGWQLIFPEEWTSKVNDMLKLLLKWTREKGYQENMHRGASPVPEKTLSAV